MQKDKDTRYWLDASVTALIISGDGLFSRMLALELEDRGVKARVGGERAAEEYDIIYVDAKNWSDRLCEYDVVIFGYREDIAPLGASIYRFPVYIRPFDVSSMLDKTVGTASPLLEKQESSPADQIRLLSEMHSVSYKGETVRLSKKEFALLSLLFESRGSTVSRERAASVFGTNGSSNVVDVYINYLRKKVEKRFDISLIKAVRGKGYVIK